MSELFIRRRVGTCLLSLGVLLLGLAAYVNLPVAPLPEISYPTFEISAALPGASADTMATSVATPLESSLSANVPGITQMTSTSSTGNTHIVVQFALSQSINGAAQNIQAAISAASGSLPKDLPSPPRYHEYNPAKASFLSVALTSDSLPMTVVDHYAEDILAKQIAQMPGVGLVDFHGPQRPAIRIELDPAKVASRGLTLEDVRTAIAAQTVNSPKGQLNGTSRTIVLNATDQIMGVEAYRNMVVAYRNGAPVLLSDLGHVVSGPEDMNQAAWYQGNRAVTLDIHKQLGANVLETTRIIKSHLADMRAALPPAINIAIVGDRTQLINASVHDVQMTMLITIALVVAVIFVFLRNLWATVIPSLTIPLSLLGSFAVMYLLGFTLDNLSLMGLVIAVGFVVDDAIVVIENIMRHLEMGKGRVQAAIDGSREVGFTVVAMTTSLIAVFIPLLMMTGIVGVLFREFAVTVCVAIVISGIVSLTVTPMLCAWLIKSGHDDRPKGAFYRWSERIFDAMTAGYGRLLDLVLRFRGLTLLVTLATFILTLWLYSVSPKGFMPQEDTGYINGTANAATDTSFAEMSKMLQQVATIVQADRDVANVTSWINPSPSSSQGRLVINLKPFSQRGDNAAKIMTRLKAETAGVVGMTLNMSVRQDIQVGGRSSAGQYQYTLQADDPALLSTWASKMQGVLSGLHGVLDVSSDKQKAATSATLVIDRATAARLGISISVIDNTLYDAFGQRQVATLYTQVSQYHVVMQLSTDDQLTASALDHLYIKSSTTQALVPLSMLGKIQTGVLPVTVNHQGGSPAITLSFNLAPGVSLSQAVGEISQAAVQAGMPATVSGSFQGTAQAFQQSLASEPWLILTAIIAVYIVLGVLYENPIHPLTVISSLPSAGVGALVALMIAGQSLSIMGMIGIILLIGIVKKNAIMIIDFALELERTKGMPPAASVREACILRFRPILMTTLAALFGALPLAIGHGPGSEIRVPLGIAIVGGLVISQILTLFTTPAVYLAFDGLNTYVRKRSSTARSEDMA